MSSNDRKTKLEYGDFQTPPALAEISAAINSYSAIVFWDEKHPLKIQCLKLSEFSTAE